VLPAAGREPLLAQGGQSEGGDPTSTAPGKRDGRRCSTLRRALGQLGCVGRVQGKATQAEDHGDRARSFPGGSSLAEVTSKSNCCSTEWKGLLGAAQGTLDTSPTSSCLEKQAGVAGQDQILCQGWGNRLWFSSPDTTGRALLFSYKAIKMLFFTRQHLLLGK